MARMTKRASQMKHALRRAYERYGQNMSPNQIKQIAKLIADNSPDCEFVERQSWRVSVWDVHYEGNAYRVVYDKNRHSIVTFLPNDTPVKWYKLNEEMNCEQPI